MPTRHEMAKNIKYNAFEQGDLEYFTFNSTSSIAK